MSTATKNISIREKNIETILNLLFSKELSASDLSRATKLSKTAIINIMSEMEEKGLVENTLNQNTPSEKWIRTKYKISKKAGLIGIIEFGSIYIKIVFTHLDGKIIEVKTIDNAEFLTLDIFKDVVNQFKLMQTEFNQFGDVLVTVISAPGQINKHTDDIVNSVKFKALRDLNIREWFEHELSSHVIIKNDINLAIIGEKEIRQDKVENAILIYIDSGIGGAILNQARLLDGDDGYAAEFGLMSTFDKFGNKIYYDLLCSINSIKKNIQYRKSLEEPTLIKKDIFRYHDVVEAFQQNDHLTVDVVKYTAEKIAEMIMNLNMIFNYKNVYIGGRIKKLGNEYLGYIQNQLKINNQAIDISFTNLDDESIIYGAVKIAVGYIFKKISLN